MPPPSASQLPRESLLATVEAVDHDALAAPAGGVAAAACGVVGPFPH